MITVRARRTVHLLAATTVALLSLASTAYAGTLEGQLTDSMTGTPIPEATIRVLGTAHETTTDESGHWQFELPDGTYELEVEVTVGDRHHEFRVVNQRVPQYKEADTHLPTAHFLDRGVPKQPNPIGAPVPRRDDPSVPDGGELDLNDLYETEPETDPGHYTLPDSPPETIRVGRRDEKTSCQSAIVAIEEMSLEEYAKGVLAPEIGVFRNQSNAVETYKAFAPAAKSYGLWFMLRYGPGNRRTVSSPKPPNDYEWFHVDNTACNQRYSDMRFDLSDQGADEMSGQVLVKEGAPDTIDKYEYAASCGGHGSRPEYQDAIVPDESPVQSCVGDWCGHDDCAGHADHPDVNHSCGCCLVRGICQWGSLEWAENGKSATWLIDHYQPNLELRQLYPSQAETVTLTGFVYDNPDDISGSGIAGAMVELSDGQQTTSNGDGRYTFDQVAVAEGTVTITASKSGYATNSREKELESGTTNWGSVHLSMGSETPDMAEPMVDAGDTGPDVVERPDTAPADTGAGEMADTTPDTSTGADTDSSRGPGPYGGLGPMVAPSSGIEGGCSCSTPQKKPSGPSPLPAGLVALGLVVLRSRRGR